MANLSGALYIDLYSDNNPYNPLNSLNNNEIKRCDRNMPISPKMPEYVKPTKENVNHPDHYNKHPSGVECIDVAEHMSFNLGNALKYIWRCDEKLDAIEDLKKAQFYINREIEKRLKK